MTKNFSPREDTPDHFVNEGRGLETKPIGEAYALLQAVVTRLEAAGTNYPVTELWTDLNKVLRLLAPE